MDLLSWILLSYYVIVNIFLFISMGRDKRAAKQHRRRIAEKQLFVWSILGGALGAYVGMRYYHHKTKHLSFMIGIPVILLVQMAVLLLWLGVLK